MKSPSSSRRNSQCRLLPTEHQIQSAFTEWWEVFARSKGINPLLGFAIPNGGMRHPAVAGKLKAEGVKPGVPDWLIAAPRGGFHGLFIEFKTEIGREKRGQGGMALLLRGEGYRVELCRSVAQGISVVMDYFGHKAR